MSKIGEQLRDYLQAKISVYRKKADEEYEFGGCGPRYRKNMNMVKELAVMLFDLNFPEKINEREQDLLNRIKDYEEVIGSVDGDIKPSTREYYTEYKTSDNPKNAIFSAETRESLFGWMDERDKKRKKQEADRVANREIKVRAWNGEMYGPSVEADIKRSVGFEVETGWSGQTNDDFIWMLYTGLKDKSGAEIYEGDILEDTSGHCIKVNSVIPPRKVGEAWMFRPEEYMVVGNIYENPELMEK